jgi:hypothetical protein
MCMASVEAVQRGVDGSGARTGGVCMCERMCADNRHSFSQFKHIKSAGYSVAHLISVEEYRAPVTLRHRHSSLPVNRTTPWLWKYFPVMTRKMSPAVGPMKSPGWREVMTGAATNSG